jgi:hypothetical protein
MIYYACLSQGYYFEFNVPSNVFEIRRKFLDAVKEHAEELLASLRDDVYPYLDEAEVRDRLVGWAERHHLYKRASWPIGLWLVDACHKTLLDWRQSPERLGALHWGVQAESFSHKSWARPDERFLESLFGRGFRFEFGPWNRDRETWEEYEARLRTAFETRLDWEKRLYNLFAYGYDTSIPCEVKYGDDHFRWLVFRQVKGWSINKIAKQCKRTWSTVDQALRRTARSLIGSGWEKWLRTQP